MPRSRFVLALLALVLLVFIAGDVRTVGAPGSGAPGTEFVPGEVLVKFKVNAVASTKLALLSELGANTLTTFTSGAEHWRLGSGVSVEQAIQRLKVTGGSVRVDDER